MEVLNEVHWFLRMHSPHHRGRDIRKSIQKESTTVSAWAMSPKQGVSRGIIGWCLPDARNKIATMDRDFYLSALL